MFDIDGLRGLTHATIRAAFNTSEEIMEEHGDMFHDGMAGCNVTSILTRIMQDVGRFSERWSSDALYGLDKIRAVAGDKFVLTDGEPFDEIVCFAIRRDGVDHGNYIMQNLIKDRTPYQPYCLVDKYYRRVLAVRCRAWTDPDLRCVRVGFSLRDISNSFHGIELADLAGDERDNKLLILEDRVPRKSPVPQDMYLLDRHEIKAAKSEGYKRFECFEIEHGQLAKEGADGECACIEIRGFYGSPVPDRENPGKPVARVYAVGGVFIPVWIDRWYEHYDAVKRAIAIAEADLGKEAA